MSGADWIISVPEELYSVAPDLDFGSCHVIRKPRGETIDWVMENSPGLSGLITLLMDRVTPEVLDRLSGLEVIANCAVGVDNIDIASATARGVWVTNTPGVLTEATADLTWALILAVVRRIGEGREAIVKREFHGWGLDYLLGLDLHGKVLGILGLGRIGKAVARRGRAFGMEVRYFDIDRKEDFEEECGGSCLPLEKLLSIADVVSIHLPLDPDTRHRIGEKELGIMKPDAVLINTSRGSVIDEEALIRVLKSGHLFGAGLDVFENEPDIPEDLLSMPNVVVVPHIGSATRETRARMARMAHDNLMAVVRRREPPNPVNQPAGRTG